MYRIKLINHSHNTLTTSDGKMIIQNAAWQTGNLGNGWVKSDQAGAMNFMDIGDQHIPGDSGETWGVLITYQGEEFVGRYEGGGELLVVINTYMQAELSGMNLREVSLPAMTVAQS